MNFKFSNEMLDIQASVSKFVKKEIWQNEFEKKGHIPKEVIDLLASLDFFSLKIPEKYGGISASWLEMGIIAEELAKGNASTAFLLMVTWITNQIIAKFGNKEVQEQWLPDLSIGKKLGSISVSEPDCGSDMESIKTKYHRDGSDYIINGLKGPVSFIFQADFVIIFATDGEEDSNSNLSAFLIPLNLPLIEKTEISNMGMLPAKSGYLTFKGVRISEKLRLGKEGNGKAISKLYGSFSDFFRILSGLIPMGIAQRALSLSIEHAKNRHAFGRPIAQFQAISGKIAENNTLIELGRWLCYRALWLKDLKSDNVKEASMCSLWCPKTAYKVIEDAILIHGHVGYSDEYPFEQMFRDAIAFEIIGGTEEAMKLVVAQKIMGKRAVPDELSRKIIS